MRNDDVFSSTPSIPIVRCSAHAKCRDTTYLTATYHSLVYLYHNGSRLMGARAGCDLAYVSRPSSRAGCRVPPGPYCDARSNPRGVRIGASTDGYWMQHVRAVQRRQVACHLAGPVPALAHCIVAVC